jgi:hypothetical protein
MHFLWAVCLPLSIAYTIPQIFHTYKAKCQGELSTLSGFLTLLGSLGRVFTAIREVKDWSVFLVYLLNVILNEKQSRTYLDVPIMYWSRVYH